MKEQRELRFFLMKNQQWHRLVAYGSERGIEALKELIKLKERKNETSN